MPVAVAVVGGGPAGCAAALALRSHGVATTLITAPRTREKPTETAVPRLKHLLRSLGADEALAACEPCYGIEPDWGAPGPVLQSAVLNASGHSWFIHRDRFDAALLRLAGAAGATVLETEATSVRFADGLVTVSTAAGVIEARNLVIATGSPPWAARATDQKPVTADTLLCYWARLPVPIESRLLHVETTATGWWYACTGGPTAAHACFLTDTEEARRLGPSKPEQWNALFQDTRIWRRHVAGGHAERIGCLPVSVAALPRRRGAGWVAVGDAAVKLDPIGSSGTATAIASGISAAQVLLADEQEKETAAERHDRWEGGLLTEFLKRRTPLYAAEAQKYPTGFWARRSRAPQQLGSNAPSGSLNRALEHE